MDAKLLESWVKNGMMVVDPDDGATVWTPAAKKVHKPATLTLLSVLLYEGREVFDKQCSYAGYKPEKILSDSSLDTETGMALEDDYD